MVDFTESIWMFEAMGGFDVVLPFLLIFTVSYALLRKIQIFGDETKKEINIIIALVVAFFFVSPQNYIFGIDMVALLNSFLPRVSFVIIVGLMFILVIGLFGGGAEWEGWTFNIAVILSILAIIWALLPEAFIIEAGWPGWLTLSQRDKSILLTVAVFVLVVWYIVREPVGEQGKQGDESKKILENLGRALGSVLGGFKKSGGRGG